MCEINFPFSVIFIVHLRDSSEVLNNRGDRGNEKSILIGGKASGFTGHTSA